MRFNVIVATYERPELLRRTLSSLSEVRRPSTFERVLVVENGSKSGAEHVCRTIEGDLPVEYHHLDTPGKSRALQYALEVVNDGFVLFIDDDIRAAPDLFEAYAGALEKHGANAFYGGPLSIDYEEPPPEWLRPHLPPSAAGWENRPGDWPWFLGANYGAAAERILAAGGLNPALGGGALRAGNAGNPVGEETDLQQRLKADGCEQVFVPAARVWHYVPRSACTPAWALDRSVRHAMSNALEQDDLYAGSPRWFGVPRWLWRAFATASLRALAAAVVPGEKRRFMLKKDYYTHLGHVKGARARHAARTPSLR